GKFSLAFYPTDVTVACGDLVPNQYPYAVAVRNGTAVITVQVAPQPFELALRPDDRLGGPASADITGNVQVGTEYGTRPWSDGHTEPISRPVYKEFTRHCTIGVLTTSGPSSPFGAPSTMAATAIGMVFGSPDQNKPPEVPSGLRMAGEYGTE